MKRVTGWEAVHEAQHRGLRLTHIRWGDYVKVSALEAADLLDDGAPPDHIYLDLPDDAPEEPGSLESQIDRLAQTIMQVCPGEPSRNEGAVDTAIRLLTQTAPESEEPDLRGALREARHTLRMVSDDHGFGPARHGYDFLDWIGDRLVNVYGVPWNTDFVLALHEKALAVRTALARANRALGEKEGS